METREEISAGIESEAYATGEKFLNGEAALKDKDNNDSRVLLHCIKSNSYLAQKSVFIHTVIRTDIK